MKQNFTKKDLKSGMIIEDQNGWRGVVIGARIYGIDGGNDISCYDDNLSCAGVCDIIKVYDHITQCRIDGDYYLGLAVIMAYLKDGITDSFKLVYDREAKKEINLTTEEMEFLKAASCFGYICIARDKDGSLMVYETLLDERQKDDDTWSYSCPYKLVAHHDVTEKTKGMFEFITWEDEEPYIIEDLLKGEIK